MNNNTVLYNKKDGTGYIVLNRPHVLNAINNDLIEELKTIIESVKTDPSVRVVIITGGEKVFCVGADLKDRWTTESSRRLSIVLNMIEELPKPTIAAVNGYALGGGCELMLCCDFRIATESTKIGLPEIKVGTMPTAGGTFRLPLLVGLQKAKELLFTGRLISGREAFDMGLVNHVVGPEHTLAKADECALELLQMPPLSIKAIKECVHHALHRDAADEDSYIGHISQSLRNSEDYAEGRLAFKEKRKPIWKGR